LVINQALGRYPQTLHEQPEGPFQMVEAIDTTEIYALDAAE
jgi:hypothetical protein